MATPTAAKLIVTTDSEEVIEIALEPKWAAKLAKQIRKGPAKMSLNGCLPAGSTHARPECQHWQIHPANFGPSDIAGWND